MRSLNIKSLKRDVERNVLMILLVSVLGQIIVGSLIPFSLSNKIYKIKISFCGRLFKKKHVLNILVYNESPFWYLHIQFYKYTYALKLICFDDKIWNALW